MADPIFESNNLQIYSTRTLCSTLFLFPTINPWRNVMSLYHGSGTRYSDLAILLKKAFGQNTNSWLDGMYLRGTILRMRYISKNPFWAKQSPSL